jgi:hypothetical protein
VLLCVVPINSLAVAVYMYTSYNDSSEYVLLCIAAVVNTGMLLPISLTAKSYSGIYTDFRSWKSYLGFLLLFGLLTAYLVSIFRLGDEIGSDEQTELLKLFGGIVVAEFLIFDVIKTSIIS